MPGTKIEQGEGVSNDWGRRSCFIDCVVREGQVNRSLKEERDVWAESEAIGFVAVPLTFTLTNKGMHCGEHVLYKCKHQPN